jgi:hypothetical protein
MPFEHYGEVLGLFEVTHSICAVLQGLARLARLRARLARLGVWLDAWTCLDVPGRRMHMVGTGTLDVWQRLASVWTSGRLARLASVWHVWPTSRRRSGSRLAGAQAPTHAQTRSLRTGSPPRPVRHGIRPSDLKPSCPLK